MDLSKDLNISFLKSQVAALPNLLAAVSTLEQVVKVANAILVEGVSSCGKTTIIKTLAVLCSQREDVGNSSKPRLVTLHLGEHTDAKVGIWEGYIQ